MKNTLWTSLLEDDEDKISTVVSSARKGPQLRHVDVAKPPKTLTPHLLENSKASRGGIYDVKRGSASDKQLRWEEKKVGKNWNTKRRNRGRGRGGRKGPRKKSNFNPRKGRGGKRPR
ncbi:unnamed protein product [Pocillopora meandrina]|uniref:Uncharacterized protein n=1 Tax=Pocillopora meandrina TaxID=46732 RepID=A0AAU9X9I5_9CNID|nr:unnamed protein product [Pocillopora meandrina]